MKYSKFHVRPTSKWFDKKHLYIELLHIAYDVKNKVESTNEYLGHY